MLQKGIILKPSTLNSIILPPPPAKSTPHVRSNPGSATFYGIDVYVYIGSQHYFSVIGDRMNYASMHVDQVYLYAVITFVGKSLVRMP